MFSNIQWIFNSFNEEYLQPIGLLQQMVMWYTFQEHTDLVIGNEYCYRNEKKPK